MDKFSKTLSFLFYLALFIGVISAIAFFGFELFEDFGLIFGYLFIFILLPIISLSLFMLILLNILGRGFIDGIKEMSIKIFVVLLSFFLIKGLRGHYFMKKNKILVSIENCSDTGVSFIQLIGRNAKSEIDTLAPSDKKQFIFRGKRINYETKNDFENEIEILFYHQGKWREHDILSGFNRWKVISDTLSLRIYSPDSLYISYFHKDTDLNSIE